MAVVSRDLTKAVRAEAAIAGLRTLQQLLDDWQSTHLKVERIYAELNEAVEGRRRALRDRRLRRGRCTAPLPRAYQWADGSAYVNHVELVRRARSAEMPASFWTDPLMYQGGATTSSGRATPIGWRRRLGHRLRGRGRRDHRRRADGRDAGAGAEHIRLLMLVNDVSLRNLIPAELAKGFGFFHSKPATAFSPVAVTPDELGDAWRGGKVHLPLLASINGRLLGRAELVGRDRHGRERRRRLAVEEAEALGQLRRE